jgi:hypothetical protein
LALKHTPAVFFSLVPHRPARFLSLRQSRQTSEVFLGAFEGDEEAFRTYEAVQAAAEAAEALLEVLEQAEAAEAQTEGESPEYRNS